MARLFEFNLAGTATDQDQDLATDLSASTLATLALASKLSWQLDLIFFLSSDHRVRCGTRANPFSGLDLMSISPLLSVAATALAPVARDVIGQIADGLSFEKLIGRDNQAGGKVEETSSDDSATRFPNSPAAAQLKAIYEQPWQALEAYVERLRERLSAAGIELTDSIALQVGPQGDVQVDGLHRDRATIEELLATDSELSSTFRQLAGILPQQLREAGGNQHGDTLQLSIDAEEFTLALT